MCVCVRVCVCVFVCVCVRARVCVCLLQAYIRTYDFYCSLCAIRINRVYDYCLSGEILSVHPKFVIMSYVICACILYFMFTP